MIRLRFTGGGGSLRSQFATYQKGEPLPYSTAPCTMQTNRAQSVFHVKHLRHIALIAVLALFVSSCTVSRNPISGKKRAYGYSWAQERQLGADADKQIQAMYGFYEDEALNRYVREVGEEVLAESHVRRPDAPREFRETPFVFRVLDSPVVNAFALPGGFVYVTRGLVAHLNNEAQLAVVLGHEIGHVEARHASQRAFEQQLGQLALLGGAIAGQELLGLPAQDLLNIGGAAAQLMFLRYGRDDERESDNLGVEYAARAGYDASEGAEFFRSLRRISEKEGQALPSFLSTHPDPGEREATIREKAELWGQDYATERLEQRDLYNALSGTVLGENPRQGFVSDGIFYHPDLRFQFPVPRGFKLANQASQVVMVDEQQRAIQVFTIAQQNSAQAAAQHLAGQEGVQTVDSGTARSNGLQAYYVVADAQTQEGQVLRLLGYFIEHGDNVYSFLAYSARDDFSQFENTFLGTMRGFAPLTDPEILNAQPIRAEIVRAPNSAPFNTFVPERLPRDLTPEDVAIMNQVELNQQVPTGFLMKLPARSQ